MVLGVALRTLVGSWVSPTEENPKIATNTAEDHAPNLANIFVFKPRPTKYA
jgi:hypothetical protein